MGNGSRNRLEYENRVNRVIDYIQAHRAEPLSLESLAQVAAFSPFHFHRVFKSITGENLREFVQRVRLEWAGSMLSQRPHVEVIEIALDSGFQSASAFARAFKEHFGMTATAWRGGGTKQWSKLRMADSKPGQADSKPGEAEGCQERHPVSRRGSPPASEKEDTMNVSVKTLPPCRLAYMRHVGPYGAGSSVPQLWQRMQRWAAARELWTPERLCLGMAHDDPHVTAPEKCRYDAAIAIAADFQPDAQVNVIDLSGGRFAVAPFEGTGFDIAASWDRLFADWLPVSGYQPDEGPYIERYHGEAFDERTGVVKCELCLSVKPL